PNLINFSVSANQLTGGIPTLDGLALQNFYVGANNLTGDVPAAPASLIAGGSSLCDNPLNHTPDPAWDAATGNSPWYANCSFTSTTTTLGSSLNPSVAGQGVTFTATVAGQSPFGSVTFADGSNVLCNAVTLTASQAACSTSSLAAGSHTITASYSGDGVNAPSSGQLTQAVNPAISFIPSGERAVLDAIYTQGNGPGWLNNSGWEGASGTECTWY